MVSLLGSKTSIQLIIIKQTPTSSHRLASVQGGIVCTSLTKGGITCMTRNQIEYWRNVETQRSNRVNEQETRRHNVATENESQRHNIRTENEGVRTNLANEDIRRQQTNVDRSRVQLGYAQLNESRRHNVESENISKKQHNWNVMYGTNELAIKEAHTANEAYQNATNRLQYQENKRHNVTQEITDIENTRIKNDELIGKYINGAANLLVRGASIGGILK